MRMPNLPKPATNGGRAQCSLRRKQGLIRFRRVITDSLLRHPGSNVDTHAFRFLASLKWNNGI
jgi:hypothetical protein